MCGHCRHPFTHFHFPYFNSVHSRWVIPSHSYGLLLWHYKKHHHTITVSAPSSISILHCHPFLFYLTSYVGRRLPTRTHIAHRPHMHVYMYMCVGVRTFDSQWSNYDYPLCMFNVVVLLRHRRWDISIKLMCD